ncbi:peroxidase 2 [Setaria italica]|uniref:peroxidase 2 n=1 Tax=Setaria italica TaxID=4555 RepID=UPI000350E341|nr:peroxidase 2 [Setaria italica]
MAKLAVPITLLLALLGSVASQNIYAPGPSPPSPRAIPDTPPRRNQTGSNPPRPTRPTNPRLSPRPPEPVELDSTYESSSQSTELTCLSSQPNPPIYPPSSSPSSSTPPTNPPPSPLSLPAYPPSPSPLSPSIPPTYPPNTSPSPTTYPSSTSPTPSANPPAYTSPSPSPASSYAPSTSPIPIPPSHPPSASPPIYPSPSPSPSIPSPSYPTPSPSPSPSSSISSPPNYPPSPSPSSSISSPPRYPPSPSPSTAPSGLSVGYYRYSCPDAESIVRAAVKNATDGNRGTGAGLIRLFFHDCFVEGCDASVLLNTTGSTRPTERASVPNLSLRGFEVIDAAKAALEAACPGVVSCADIVAFAGRDATFFLSGNAVDFDMPAGRYDGHVSLDSAAIANLPPPFASLKELKDMFAAKGLDTEDMVTLSGAHTVGRSQCSSFSDRLPPNASDMNATLAASLTSQCNGTGDPTVPQDFVTPSGLDSQYYRNVLNHEVLFGSDAALLASDQTAGMVRDNAFKPGLWEDKFKAAMVKMGRAGVKNSTDGEIRKKCWMINQVSS